MNLEDLDSSFTKQVRALINAGVRDYVGKRGKLNSLALACNLSPSTVSKLAYYETARPAWRTVIAVAEALDMMEDIGNLMILYAQDKRGGAAKFQMESLAQHISKHKKKKRA